MYVIISATGFIGGNIAQYCEALGEEYIGTSFSKKNDKRYFNFNILEYNFNDLALEIERRLFKSKKSNQEIVFIICSAYTNLDFCKKYKDESYDLNVRATKCLVNDILKYGGKIVFLSSECVFDGSQGLYRESDTPCPITEYGKQKLEVEQYIQDVSNDFLIFRLSRVVNEEPSGKDIFGYFMDKVRQGDTVNCIQNQMFCVTSVNDVSKCILLSCQSGIKGLFHLSSDNFISRYQLAKKFIGNIFGNYKAVYEIPIDQMNLLEKRPLALGLYGGRIKEILNIEYTELESIIKRYKDSLR